MNQSTCILLILSWFAILANADDKLPRKLWPAIRADKTYHLVFQIQSLGTTGKFTIEEWASFEDQTFRLDLVNSYGSVNYLTYGKSKEIFMFKPFTCNRLEPDDKDLNNIAALFRGFGIGPEANHIYSYGLGALWLRAEQDAETVKELDLQAKDNVLSREDLIGYEIVFPETSNVPYNLRFYFRKEQKDPFLSLVEWVDKTGTVQHRARVVDLDLRKQPPTIYDLPIGHGCVRGPGFDHPIKVEVGMELLHEGAPNQAVFEVTTSKPKDVLLHNWDSESYTIRIMRGSLKLNAKTRVYFSTLLQKRDPETLRLKRTKQVWAGFEGSDQAIVYTIDKETNDCNIEYKSFRNHVRLVFPGQDKTVKPLLISSDAIASIFNDNTGYHMIKEVAYGGSDRIRKAIYEKRVEEYEMKMDGVILWKGPASIVKEFTGPLFKLNDSPDEPLFFSHMSVVQTLFLFSEDYSELLYKTVFNLVSDDQLDFLSMHEQLDVSACFSADRKEEVVIKYPIESRSLVNNLMSMQNLLHEGFISNLFSQTSILPTQITDVGLTFDNFFLHVRLTLIDLPLTQVYEFQPRLRLVRGTEESGFIEKVTGDAEKCGMSCSHYNCFRFSYESAKSRCRLELGQKGALTEFAASSDLWSYSPIVVDTAWGQYEDSNGRHHLSSQQVVNIFKGSIADESFERPAGTSTGDDTGNKIISGPLSFSILSSYVNSEKSSDSFRYWFYPVSVLSDIDSMNEFEREELSGPDGEASIAVRFKDHFKFGVEYSVALEAQSYSNHAPGSKYTEVYNYEDCARFCEDANCKSFSYCEYRKICFVTKLYKTSEMKTYLTSDPRCTVYTVDYLSKFEDFGRVVPPATAKQSLEKIGPQECAAICLDSDQINCQAFYHCAGEGVQASCLLDDRHIEEIAASSNRLDITKFYSKKAAGSKKTSNRECRLYSRSYLSQFDEYHEKALNLGDQESVEASVIYGQGAEKCAQSCIEQSCLAFDVCFDPNAADRKLNHICKLAKKSVRKTHLEGKQKCNTFVLSDRSQFNTEQVTLIAERPDQRALNKAFNDKQRVVVDAEEKRIIENDINAGIFSQFPEFNRNEIIDSSNWLSKFYSMFLGVFLGVGCAFLWKSRDEVYNRVSSLTDRLRRR